MEKVNFFLKARRIVQISQKNLRGFSIRESHDESERVWIINQLQEYAFQKEI